MNKPDPKTAGMPPRPAADEDAGFLGRWSRRKAAAREPSPAARPAAASNAATSQKIEPDEAPIDPATLPPIESLTAESDFTVFLRKGVPESLRKAALQKLWQTEPSVVNYIPLVEYNWDFNAPGYGALRPTDDVAKLARAAWGQIAAPQQEKQSTLADSHAPAAVGTEPPRLGSDAGAAAAGPTVPPESVDDTANGRSSPDPKPVAVRRHGGALPA